MYQYKKQKSDYYGLSLYFCDNASQMGPLCQVLLQYFNRWSKLSKFPTPAKQPLASSSSSPHDVFSSSRSNILEHEEKNKLFLLAKQSNHSPFRDISLLTVSSSNHNQHDDMVDGHVPQQEAQLPIVDASFTSGISTGDENEGEEDRLIHHHSQYRHPKRQRLSDIIGPLEERIQLLTNQVSTLNNLVLRQENKINGLQHELLLLRSSSNNVFIPPFTTTTTASSSSQQPKDHRDKMYQVCMYNMHYYTGLLTLFFLRKYLIDFPFQIISYSNN
jgi:hypothetical protein